MNVKRFLAGCIIVSAYVFAHEWVFHGIVLEDLYAHSPPLWRTPADMAGRIPWLVMGQLMFAVLFCFTFTLGYESKGLMRGLRYGVFIGLVFTATNVIMYALQPVPYELLLAWVGGGILELTIAAIIMAVVYRPVQPSALPPDDVPAEF